MSIITLTDERLREKMKSDNSFKRHCEQFSKQLRVPKSSDVLERGIVALPGFAYVTFLCNGGNHEGCEDIVADKIICHIGNPKQFATRITHHYEGLTCPTVKLLKSQELGFSANDIIADSQISPKDIAAALTFAINRTLEGRDRKDITSMFVPGTYDIVIANKRKLAQIIRSSYDSKTGRYDLNRTSELTGLGGLVKIELAKQILLFEYRIVTNEEDYLAEEEAISDFD